MHGDNMTNSKRKGRGKKDRRMKGVVYHPVSKQ
jgi:hypothetical protein